MKAFGKFYGGRSTSRVLIIDLVLPLTHLTPHCGQKRPALCPNPLLLWPYLRRIQKIFFWVDSPETLIWIYYPTAYVLWVGLWFIYKNTGKLFFFSPPSHQELTFTWLSHIVPTENIHPSPNHPPVRAVSWYSHLVFIYLCPLLRVGWLFFPYHLKKIVVNYT